MSGPTHEDLCLGGLVWLSGQGWTEFAAHEVSLQIPAWWRKKLLDEGRHMWPHYIVRHGFADAVSVGSDRVVILEAKRTRSDLLSDLRAGKMMARYGWASYCYLLLGPELSGVTVAGLHGLGLPKRWGVLRSSGTSSGALSERSARRLNDVPPETIGKVRRSVGRSLTHRVLRAAITQG